MLQKEKKQTKRNRISATALILLSVALLLTILCACGNTDRAEGSLSSADNGEPDPPSASDQLVAHAAGAVYGYRRTNSEEALDTAYWNGFLYFELDFERTSDGKTVLIHDWDSMAGRMFGRAGQLTLEEFRTSDTFMDLTVMDLDDLLKWLDRHPDCFIITDLGSSYGTFLGNGKKLTANVAEKLSTGDTFYLCDNANRFVVSKE